MFAKHIAIGKEDLGGGANSIGDDMNQPEWATKLIAEVLASEKRSKAPKIKWRGVRYKASGTTYRASNWKSSLRNRSIFWSRAYGRKPNIIMRIEEGAVEKGLLLHELAHWLVRSGHHHDMIFWRKAWSLYFRFLTQAELEKRKQNEFSYKEKAKLAYEQLISKQ